MAADPPSRSRTILAAVTAFLLAAHGAIHLWWVSPPTAAAALVDPANAWAVEQGMSEALLRALTALLAPLVFLLFAASAVGVLGWLLPAGRWRAVTLVASLLSLLLLVLYFDPSGWVGFVVDLGLLAALISPVASRMGLPRARGARS